MERTFLWGAVIAAAAVTTLAVSSAANAANAADCPNNGVVRYGVEPFDTSPRLMPIYETIGKIISQKLGCEVQVFISTNYNAEIEAMRNGKLEIGEFGPLGYVLAHEVANAQAVADLRRRGRQARFLLGEPGDLSELRHQDGRGHARPFLRILRSRPRPPAICSRPTACARPGSIPTRT